MFTSSLNTIYPPDIRLSEMVSPIILKEKPRRKLIYVAGKYRDERGEWYVESNIREAEALAQFIWINGGIAFCPHKNTEHWGGLLPDEEWIKGDLEILSRCDAIYMLPNWHDSEGAKKEHAFAKEHHIIVFYDARDLLYYLRDE